MKIEMVGSFTAPKGNAMPEDCTRCHNAEWGTIVVDGVCVACLVKDNSTLREAGEKMEERLRMLKTYQNFCRTIPDSLNIEKIFTAEDATALAEWEAANK